MRYFKEILLVEAIIFFLFWVTNEYIATLMTFIAIPIFISVLIVSLIAERIEKSKISRAYFYLMAYLALIPFFIFIIMQIFNGGTSFDWGE